MFLFNFFFSFYVGSGCYDVSVFGIVVLVVRSVFDFVVSKVNF